LLQTMGMSGTRKRASRSYVPNLVRGCCGCLLWYFSHRDSAFLLHVYSRNPTAPKTGGDLPTTRPQIPGHAPPNSGAHGGLRCISSVFCRSCTPKLPISGRPKFRDSGFQNLRAPSPNSGATTLASPCNVFEAVPCVSHVFERWPKQVSGSYCFSAQECGVAVPLRCPLSGLRVWLRRMRR
jgi:hypothetical protein